MSFSRKHTDLADLCVAMVEELDELDWPCQYVSTRESQANILLLIRWASCMLVCIDAHATSKLQSSLFAMTNTWGLSLVLS